MKYYVKGIEDDLVYLKNDGYLFGNISNERFYLDVIIPATACVENKGEEQAVTLLIYLAGKYTTKYVSIDSMIDFKLYFERMFILNRI